MGLRDLLMNILGWGCVPLALYNPFYGFLGYIWLSVMKPQTFVWSDDVSSSRMAFAVMIALAVRLLVTPGPKIRLNIMTFCILSIWFWFAVCTVMSNFPGQSSETLLKFSKVIIGPLLVTGIIDSRERLRLFFALLAACPGLYGAKLGLFLLRGATRTSQGGPLGMDNNDTALFIAMGVPLLVYAATQMEHKWIKRGFWAAAALSVPAVIVTGSRGGLLAMAVALLLTIWRRFGSKKALSIIPLVALVGYLLVPAQTMERYDTIDEYQEDDSAMGRINSWKTAVNIANSSPIVGGGLGLEAFMMNYPNHMAVPDDSPRAAHSIWFAMLGECGYIGLSIFVAVLVVALKTGIKIYVTESRKDGTVNEYGGYATALTISIVVYAVGGTFLSAIRFEFFYYILATLGALLFLSMQKLRENGNQGHSHDMWS